MADEAMEQEIKREMRPIWMGLLLALVLATILLWIFKAPTDHAMAMRALLFGSLMSLATTIKVAQKRKRDTGSY